MLVRFRITDPNNGAPQIRLFFSGHLNFVPDGSPVTVVRDLIKTETCNGCHDRLTLHGRRHSMELCNLCHTPQSSDPDTGNTVDMPVMIHKIHMGADLPSVQAGGSYQIIGFRNSVHDYSEVVFPADPRRCVSCHAADTGATQADLWFNNPNRAACGACHDDVNFATGENHASLPQVSDAQCAGCHIPQGELEFDLSIAGAHTIPEESSELPGLLVRLLTATGAIGSSPTVTFSVTTADGTPVDASTLNRLRLSLIGPTSDYLGDPIQEDARGATGGGDGVYTYEFDGTIPQGSRGTWSISVEARQEVTLLPGTEQEMVVRDAALNDVIYFSIDGSEVVRRRTVVDRELCNACHGNLSLHGNNRKSIDYCVVCHRPDATDAEVRPADQMPSEAIDFRTMIHRIHSGSDQGREYIIYGFRSSLHNYSSVEYPGNLTNCAGCHVGNSQQVPLNQDLAQVTDPRGFLNPTGPETAACTACHASIQAASHALANTTALGESCAACHGPGRDASVNASHAQQ